MPMDPVKGSFLTRNNVRVHSYSTQGGRKYMEDTFSIAFQNQTTTQSADANVETMDRDDIVFDQVSCVKYVYCGIFDGHGGKEASEFTREHLLRNITSIKGFWSDDDGDICQAIREGFLNTHHAMLNVLEKWPTTNAGLPSTSGTTASICFLMNDKMYTGHVGDSRIVLAKKHRETKMWIAHPLTRDHKPDSPEERERIAAAGGEVMNKSGVDRVVWYRPKNGHKGPIRRSTNFDRIPFLAVARSLGDLWSYNPDLDKFIVSPEPDVQVTPIDEEQDKCLVFASDGLWNMILDHESIRMMQEIQEPEVVQKHLLNSVFTSSCKKLNPAQVLCDFAIQKWHSNRLRADNTSVIVLSFEKRSEDSLPTSSDVPQDARLLPFTMRPFEYLISSDESQVGPRENFIESFNSTFVKIAQANNELDPVHDDIPELKNLSPPLQSLCSLTNGRFISPSDQQVPTTPLPETSWNSELSEVYVNELPDDKFSALSKSLKLSGSYSYLPKAHKVINGVEVFKDYEDDEDSRSSGENDETRANGKTFRDESCSVTEELVDRHHSSTYRHDSIISQIQRVPRPPEANDANILKDCTKISNETKFMSPKRSYPIDGSDSNIKGISFKRRRSGNEASPPAKHLRSSKWSRGRTLPLRTKWTKLAASILTKSRLRARKSSNRH